MIQFKVNGRERNLDVDPDMPLLWVLRDELGMHGTKFGCGKALCGACSVLVDGELTRCCVLPVSSVAGKEITTIEAVADGPYRVVQQAWTEDEVPQCGYCQSGQIMAAVALLKSKPKPTDAEIDESMANICRCGTYPRIRAAVHRASALLGGAK
jgi:isoquinoline 1-oxidoreductase alpha subunit